MNAEERCQFSWQRLKEISLHRWCLCEILGWMGMASFFYKSAAASCGCTGMECFCHCMGLGFLTRGCGDSVMQLQRTEKADMSNTLGRGCMQSRLQLHFNHVMWPSPLWPGALFVPLLVSLFYHTESDKAKALLYGMCIYTIECDAELVERRKWHHWDVSLWQGSLWEAGSLLQWCRNACL